MSRMGRFVVFGVGALCTSTLVGLALFRLPAFGASVHPYRTAAVAAAVSHATSNVISSINFDLRGFDTLGEETIFLTSVLVIAVILRPASDENEQRQPASGRPLDSTVFGGLLFVPLTLILGFDVVTHGHLTPGGGFQGGVILGTSIHLLYVAGTYATLERVRPVRPFEWGEAIGAGAFACLGISGVVLGVAFLANVIPTGVLGTLFSSGSVALLNGVVGIEVASGVVVLLSKFLEQALTVRTASEATNRSHPNRDKATRR
jgi:multicomponent Na+:H+ antiporter subunit B